jgi:hypothetical protein
MGAESELVGGVRVDSTVAGDAVGIKLTQWENHVAGAMGMARPNSTER